MSIQLILLLLAFIAFVLATINVPVPRVNLIGLGLALWVLSLLIK
jgi:hypothetical protein